MGAFRMSVSDFDEKQEIEILPADNPRELRLGVPLKPGFSRFPSPPIQVNIPANPDPSNYEIIDYKEFDNFLAIRIRYLDCTNYEGQKILVYQDIKVIDLWNQKTIDPHFSENKDFHSPIARFLPTNEGWQMALKFITVMEQ